MARKFNPEDKNLLLETSRQELIDPQRILSFLPLRTYQIVGDIGCGPGYFTIPLAKYLFDGKVWAVDVQQEMLDALQERLKQVHLTNVEPLLSSDAKLPFDKDSLDGALLAFVLHETKNKKGFLAQVKESLKKGGWAAILEWYKKETEYGPPLEARIEEEEAQELVAKAGFRFTSLRDLNGKHYMLLLRK
ncbi:MAG: class I SAM-dependent methyltransferase [Chloroflexi bacterium]|nr:class I SAM-dependent methyltransferase [Chloroflexota bacterium]